MKDLKAMLKLVEDTNVLAKQVAEMAKQVVDNQRKINEYFELEDEDLILDTNGNFDSNNTANEDAINNQEVVSERTVSEFITQLGIPAHIKGYRYVISAIMLAFENINILDSITQKLYPTIAKMCDTTSCRVERAIRHAIEVAWERGNLELQEKVFGFTIDWRKGKPTNSEFIAMIANKLKFQY